MCPCGFWYGVVQIGRRHHSQINWSFVRQSISKLQCTTTTCTLPPPEVRLLRQCGGRICWRGGSVCDDKDFYNNNVRITNILPVAFEGLASKWNYIAWVKQMVSAVFISFRRWVWWICRFQVEGQWCSSWCISHVLFQPSVSEQQFGSEDQHGEFRQSLSGHSAARKLSHLSVWRIPLS